MPNLSTATITPVPLGLYDSDIDRFAAQIGASFELYGFAVVSDIYERTDQGVQTGLDAGVIDKALAATKAFFALPLEIKQTYHIKGGGGQRGYTPFGIETAKDLDHHDLKEFWHMGRELADLHPYLTYMPGNIWPIEVHDFESHISHLYEALDQLGLKILRAIALYLRLDPDFFTPTVKDGNSILRLLHYPPVDKAGDSIRAAAHSDINVITLLLGAEEPGLQLLDRDGLWLDVTPKSGSIVVNIGDMLERLTNKVLPSTVHRVINPAIQRKAYARYSTPFFLHFAPDYLIETLKSCQSDTRPNAFVDAITADAFLRQRLMEIKLT
jgi:isopenicillin N synthase-like dioxygenase